MFSYGRKPGLMMCERERERESQSQRERERERERESVCRGGERGQVFKRMTSSPRFTLKVSFTVGEVVG